MGGYKNKNTGDNESIVLDSDPDSSDTEVSSEGSSEISSDHIDFGNEWDDNGPNTVNHGIVTANANIPSWTTNLTDITIQPLTQDSGPSLPENFDISVATVLDYINSLFKPEIFSDIRDQKITMQSSNKIPLGETEIILTMLIVCGRIPWLKN